MTNAVDVPDGARQPRDINVVRITVNKVRFGNSREDPPPEYTGIPPTFYAFLFYAEGSCPYPQMWSSKHVTPTRVQQPSPNALQEGIFLGFQWRPNGDDILTEQEQIERLGSMIEQSTQSSLGPPFLPPSDLDAYRAFQWKRIASNQAAVSTATQAEVCTTPIPAAPPPPPPPDCNDFPVVRTLDCCSVTDTLHNFFGSTSYPLRLLYPRSGDFWFVLAQSAAATRYCYCHTSGTRGAQTRCSYSPDADSAYDPDNALPCD